jgi:hypothetical protein
MLGSAGGVSRADITADLTPIVIVRGRGSNGCPHVSRTGRDSQCAADANPGCQHVVERPQALL